MSKTLAGVLAFAALASAQAATTFTATLTPGQEVPPVVNPTTSSGQPRPAASGAAVFILNDAMTSLSFEATLFNIDLTGSQSADTNDNLVNAHIHAGASTGQPGTNAGVVWGFIGAPFNDTAPTDTVVTPFASGVGGTVVSKWDMGEGNGGTTLTAQLPNILQGRSYINFHTVQFGGGEIRGQILAVPEPETYALMLAGLGALGFVARRRAR